MHRALAVLFPVVPLAPDAAQDPADERERFKLCNVHKPYRPEGAECVGAARHARERAGVGAGLVRSLPARDCDGSPGSSIELVPGVAGRRLFRRLRRLPDVEARHSPAREPSQLPSAESANLQSNGR